MRMRRLVHLLFCCCLVPLPAAGAAPSWSFTDGYRKPLLYLHVLEGYDWPTEWRDDWESNRLRRNALRLNYGSVTSDRLLVDEQLQLNRQLANNYWFRGEYRHIAGRLNEREEREERSFLVGLERRLLRGFGLFAQFDPASAKEEIDVRVGLLLGLPTGERYLRLAYCADDLLFTDKNPYGARSLRTPTAVAWTLRHRLGSWSLYSDGKLGRDFIRVYPDRTLSPELTFQRGRDDRAEARLAGRFKNGVRLILGSAWSRFGEERHVSTPGSDYRYRNLIVHASAAVSIPTSADQTLRLTLHHVRQRAESGLSRNFSYRRSELLPAVAWDLRRAEDNFGVAVMASFQRWAYRSPLPAESYREDGYIDKLRLSWSRAFGDDACLSASLSHVLDRTGFGGGNVQYQMFF